MAAATDRIVRPTLPRFRRIGLITLILLMAAAFRLVDLPSIPPGMTGVPPGMTHDEADHGLTAWAVVNGARDLYFTVGYGREPLYDYATALVMAGTGPTIFAARLTSVYFSLIMIAAVYAWSRRAFGAPVALLAAAGLAVGFWPVMAGRQALRSIALPAVFAVAVLFFWQGLVSAGQGRKGAGGKGSRGETSAPSPLLPVSPSPLLIFTLAGLLLGLTFYTYIPARVMWPAFPALAAYLAFAAPPAERQMRDLLGGTALTLIVAALVAAPLFFYLANNPGVEVRIDELRAPLDAAASGDFGRLLDNALGALRLFTIEGDRTWRYNIPGKPFLGPVMGVLFYAGLVVAAWLAVAGLRRNRVKNRVFSEKPGFYNGSTGPGAFLSLVWLALGIAPVMVTGPGLSMTQAIGALPALYVFPALALAGGFGLLKWMTERNSTQRRKDAKTRENLASRRPGVLSLNSFAPLLALVLFAAVAAQTARDYFGRWANEPEVRVQYETAMVTALRWLDERGGAAAVSTITPGRYHTPAVALMTLRNPDVRPRWFDGRQSLLFPAESGGLLLVPGFTPIPAELQPYLADATPVDELPMRPDDLDRPIRVYELDGPPAQATIPERMATAEMSVRFGDYVELTGYELSSTGAHPGDTLALVTAWRLDQPLPDASLFAHLIGPDGRPIAQADGLGAPGESWVAGDVLLQLHHLTVPPDTPPGQYPLSVGLYTPDDGRRVTAAGGADAVPLTTVTVLDG